MDEAKREKIMKELVNDRMAKFGLKVLALAYKDIDAFEFKELAKLSQRERND